MARFGSSCGLQELEHAGTESLSGEEIGFGITEFVMSVPRIGRLFFGTDKVMCRDEDSRAAEVGVTGGEDREEDCGECSKYRTG